MLAATRSTILRTLPPMAAAITLLCVPGYAETLDELYAKARNEKSLVIYAGGPVSRAAGARLRAPVSGSDRVHRGRLQ